ncbi:hypothetical protein [Actinokineospora sp. UTMC 2448]|uniref:hypothetical protein n=1 Tax=Actinokineospora sp. UTMC 2448 TaxID=2268449 RepID=UPI00216413DB|nr:hypothetical protein [Actinokineospora sp. UTMC 2448]UVS79468.1 hypothetical protein Actkin_03216 [Actinokineospora sp. UTMC 2448]
MEAVTSRSRVGLGVRRASGGLAVLALTAATLMGTGSIAAAAEDSHPLAPAAGCVSRLGNNGYSAYARCNRDSGSAEVFRAVVACEKENGHRYYRTSGWERAWYAGGKYAYAYCSDKDNAVDHGYELRYEND